MTETAEIGFDPADPELRRDPYPVYRRLQSEAPVWRSPDGVFYFSRYEDCFALFRSPALSYDPTRTAAFRTPYGLGSYIQTSDLRRAHRVAERLIAGNTMINGAPNMMVNRPMGGFGVSGFGKEGGPEGLAEFQRIKTVAML